MNPNAYRAVRVVSVLLSILSFAAPVASVAQWYVQYRPADAGYSSVAFRDVQAVNDSVVFAIAGTYRHPILGAPTSAIFLTSDRGEHWTRVSADTGITYVHAQFVSETVGYLIADRDRTGILLKTQDGGITWRQIYEVAPLITTPTTEPHFLYDLHFQNQDSGFIAVDDRPQRDGYATLRRTTDGGATWATVLGGSWQGSRDYTPGNAHLSDTHDRIPPEQHRRTLQNVERREYLGLHFASIAMECQRPDRALLRVYLGANRLSGTACQQHSVQR